MTLGGHPGEGRHPAPTALWPFVASGLVLPTGPPPESGQRAAHHVSFCVRGAHRKDLVAAMEESGVMVSGGSACSGDVSLPSHVLDAIGIPDAYIRGSLRITLGLGTTPADVTNILVPALQRVLRNTTKKR